MTEPEWKQLEILVAKIQKELAPDAKVQHNAKIIGDLGVERQIDVLVTQKIGQYEMKIAIDCKDYSSPVDVKGVEEFCGLVEDIKAHKSAMVCPKGFTETAKKLAIKKQVDLYSPFDTDPHKWQVKATAPVLCISKELKYSIGLSVSVPLPFQMPSDFHLKSIISLKDGRKIGTPAQIVRKRWSGGKYPNDVGLHKDVPIYEEPCFMDNGYGQVVPVELTVSLYVYEKRFFGHVPITQVRGLKDEQTGMVITKNFTTQFLSADEIVKQWKEIKEGEELPINPLFEIEIMDYCEEK